MAVRLLRLLKNGELPDAAWRGWQLHQGKLYPPTGRSFEPWEIEHLDATLRRAQMFEEIYDRLKNLTANGGP